jgi:uncharacterized membrane protein YphA (DoxX/SURF4 family)
VVRDGASGPADPRFVDRILDWPATWLAARVALCGAYLIGGVVKLSDWQAAVAEQAGFGIHPASVSAAATIAVELVGPVLILSGRLVWLGAGMLGVFTAFAAIVANPFWSMPAGRDRFMAANGFLEHVGLVGASFWLRSWPSSRSAMRSVALIAALLATPAAAQAETQASAPQAVAEKPPVAASAASAAEPGAAAQTGLDAWQAPTLTITRYDEHWTQLSDPELREEHWTAPFKYIPIGSEGWLTTGTELRARSESYHENTWGFAAAPNDTYLWLRAMPYADLHVGRGVVGVRAFAQPIIAYAIGVSPSPGPTDQTRLDMLQGFADVRIGADTGSTDGYGATLRAGRQMISLGTERLVGTRYGPNVPLAFDGVRGMISFKGGVVTLLSVRPVLPGPHTFDDTGSDMKHLWGAYAVLPHPGVSNVDLYFLGYRNTEARFGGVTGREVRRTFGVRLYGKRAGWHWDLEAIGQRGHFVGQRIRAWAVGTDVGKTFADLPLAPDFDVRFNVVSGDRHAGNGKLGTFDALFPKGKYFGELSPIGPVNIVSVNPRVTVAVAPGWSAGLAAMGYWRYSNSDGIYGVPGNLLRAANGSSARFIGKQQEGIVGWQATPELTLSASLSFFEAGRFIRDTGPSRTIRMIGTEANFRF